MDVPCPAWIVSLPEWIDNPIQSDTRCELIIINQPSSTRGHCRWLLSDWWQAGTGQHIRRNMDLRQILRKRDVGIAKGFWTLSIWLIRVLADYYSTLLMTFWKYQRESLLYMYIVLAVNSLRIRPFNGSPRRWRNGDPGPCGGEQFRLGLAAIRKHNYSWDAFKRHKSHCRQIKTLYNCWKCRGWSNASFRTTATGTFHAIWLLQKTSFNLRCEGRCSTRHVQVPQEQRGQISIPHIMCQSLRERWRTQRPQ